MERYSIFLGRKNQYCEKYYITKCSLQIQCDSYQITNGIFHKTKTKNFTIRVETQKTLNSQRSLKKKEWSWRNQHSWPQIILQNYSHQDSMILAPKQKYRPMEQDRKPINKPMHLWAPFIEEAVFAPLYILASFVKNKVPIGAWVYLWAFYLVPLVYISVFVPVPYCLDDCSFVV